MALCIASTLISAADRDPEIEAAQITAEIQTGGATVELLCERAYKWRTLRKPDLAAQDYRQAIQLDPKNFLAHLELAKVLLSTNELKSAKKEVDVALELAPSSTEKAAAYMFRASVQIAFKAFQYAEADCDEALSLQPEHGLIEWYLRRAYVQHMTGSTVVCEQGLRNAYQKTKSAVIYAQWVDALIDAERWDEALTEINSQLPSLRLKSGWLLKEGRALLGLNRAKEAGEAFREAVTEIDRQLETDSAHPDLTLLVDRALAQVLLGNRAQAKKDYQAAKKAGADSWMLWRLEKILN